MTRKRIFEDKMLCEHCWRLPEEHPDGQCLFMSTKYQKSTRCYSTSNPSVVLDLQTRTVYSQQNGVWVATAQGGKH